mmetsp:Transcript_16824/g.38750  ORF Transcript_16824/g.38750 Transcript_16824/m.38750 type:complete len:159 (-) Transcript_16824:1801-2277(-)
MRHLLPRDIHHGRRKDLFIQRKRGEEPFRTIVVRKEPFLKTITGTVVVCVAPYEKSRRETTQEGATEQKNEHRTSCLCLGKGKRAPQAAKNIGKSVTGAKNADHSNGKQLPAASSRVFLVEPEPIPSKTVAPLGRVLWTAMGTPPTILRAKSHFLGRR